MKLSGVKVLDLSLFLPGPHLSMMMADHGAEVIKLEPPAGEPVRNVGLKQDQHSVWFRNTHRGKRCIKINLKSEQGVELFKRLAADVDVIIEAFRPGVVDRLGIGYEAIKAINPGIVYCAISAYGQTGPDRLKPAHDLSIQAASGTVSINLGSNNEPAMPAMPCADMAGSLMAFSGILMALLKRKDSGQGDYLDVSMQDSLVAWLPNVMGPVFAEERPPIVKEERSWGGAAFYNLYKTADGQTISLGGSELNFVSNLLTALGRPELIELCKLQPGPGQDPVKTFLAEQFLDKTMKEWQIFLKEIDLCWSPVVDLKDAVHSEHLAAREMLVTDDQGNKHLGIPIKYQQEPGKINNHLDEIGESTESFLLDSGLTEDEIKNLQKNKAI